MAWYGHLEFYPFTAPAYGLHMAFLVPGKHSVPELYLFLSHDSVPVLWRK